MLGELLPWLVLEEGKVAVLGRIGSWKTAFPKADCAGDLWGCRRAKLLALCPCLLPLERGDERGEMSRGICSIARWWAPAAGATGVGAGGAAGPCAACLHPCIMTDWCAWGTGAPGDTGVSGGHHVGGRQKCGPSPSAPKLLPCNCHTGLAVATRCW